MKDGKKVNAFAADGKGKMAKGGMAKMMRSGGKACYETEPWVWVPSVKD
jgi:hypothetical protein